MALRQRSRKTEAAYRKRRPLVAQLLEDRPLCERCMTERSSEVHEIKSRARGGSILDLDNLSCLCHWCHRWVTENPREAHVEGWLKQSWE